MRGKSVSCRRIKRRLPLLLVAVLPFFLKVSISYSAGADKPGFFSYFGARPSKVLEIAQHYDLAVWHNNEENRIILRQVKQRKPDFIAFMYRELFCILEQETRHEESIGHYDWIDAHHPEWFQKDIAGNRVEVPDYPGRWMMDMGNRAFQDFWIQETLKDLRESPWDGAFADDALTNVRAHDLPPLAGYPDDASMQEAVYVFLRRARQALAREGFLLVANVTNSADFPGLWEKWLGVTDGLMEEYFAGRGWTWGDRVAQRQLEAMRQARERNKWMFCMTYGPWEDRARLETSLIAFGLGSGSKLYWSYRPGDDGDDMAWEAARSFDAFFERIGEPLGEPEPLGESIWVRRFERGTLALNVSPMPAEAIWGGQSLRLAPHEAVVME